MKTLQILILVLFLSYQLSAQILAGQLIETTINTYLARQQEWAALDNDSRAAAFKSYINYLKSRNDNNTVFSYAYGTGLLPKPDSHPPNINYPYY